MSLFADVLEGLVKAAPRFSSWGGGPWGRFPMQRGMPGERDWTKIVGDGSGNSIVIACVGWLSRAITEAPIVVVDEGEDVPQIIRDHELARLFRRPNPYYSGTLMLYGLINSFVIDGNAYLMKVRDQLGRVRELWYTPHQFLEPRWTSDGNTYLSHYDYTPDGPLVQLAPEDVYHLRYGLDGTTRKGISPLHTLFREIGVDEEASRFSASL